MAEIINVRPSDLVLDENNPRLPEGSTGQYKTQRTIAEDQQRKLLNLARDIVRWGMNPTELSIVRRMEGKQKQYKVVEGNRRLTALRALESPEAFVGALDPVILKEMRALSQDYQANPVESVPCVLIQDRKLADHWIELRHTGQNAGAGVVPWDTDGQGRFKKRSGQVDLTHQVLDWMSAQGKLSQKERAEIPVTTLRRLLGTPAVRKELGIGLDKKQMQVLGKPNAVVKALRYVISDLTSDDGTKVDDVYTTKKRLAYAKRLPDHIRVAPADSAEQPPSGSKKPVKKKPRRAAPRENLIPRDCTLNVTDARILQIEFELRDLNIDNYTNAVAVLLRVFVELSVDHYLSLHRLSAGDKPKLRAKMQKVVEDLRARDMLTAQQAQPVRTALQKNSFLATSVDAFNGYVHNKHVFPAPVDLRSGWDNLQPFLVAIWA